MFGHHLAKGCEEGGDVSEGQLTQPSDVHSPSLLFETQVNIGHSSKVLLASEMLKSFIIHSSCLGPIYDKIWKSKRFNILDVNVYKSFDTENIY